MKRLLKASVLSVLLLGVVLMGGCGSKTEGDDSDKTELDVNSAVVSRAENSGESSDGKFSIREAIEKTGGLQAFVKSLPATNDRVNLSCEFNGDNEIAITITLKDYIDPDEAGVKDAFAQQFDSTRKTLAAQIKEAEKGNVRPFTYAVKIMNTDGSVLYEMTVSDQDAENT